MLPCGWAGGGKKKQMACHRFVVWNVHMRQNIINYKDLDFAKIINRANSCNFPKICDFCGEIFEANLFFYSSSKKNLNCPICFSLYIVVYNDLNDFNYLEFIKPPDSIYLENKPFMYSAK